MEPLLASLIVVAAVAVLLLTGGLVLAAKLRASARHRSYLQGEGRRVFGYLHHLGQAIADDFSSRKLFRVIVEGLEEVLDAQGAALYIVDEEREALVPAYLSQECPPLFELCASDRRKFRRKPEALLSYLRLAKVPEGESVLWNCLRDGGPMRVPAGGAKGEASSGDLLLAPVRHAGRDLGVLAVAGSPGRTFSDNDFEVFCSLAEQSSFALGNSLMHREVAQKRSLERELRMASEVQRVLLPADDPELPGFRIRGTNVPASIVSGDYYDYLDLSSGELGVAIADVSGKGVSAGLLMATCRSALRALARGCDSPARALAAVNRQLFHDMHEDMFISMAYLVLRDGENRLRLARAGHEPPLLYRAEQRKVEVLKPAGLAIGIDRGPVFERVTRDYESPFVQGDCLLLYTDGVTEAENAESEEFGKARLQRAFAEAAPLGAGAVVEMLQEELGRFVAGHRQLDDVTMVAIEKR